MNIFKSLILVFMREAIRNIIGKLNTNTLQSNLIQVGRKFKGVDGWDIDIVFEPFLWRINFKKQIEEFEVLLTISCFKGHRFYTISYICEVSYFNLIITTFIIEAVHNRLNVKYNVYNGKNHSEYICKFVKFMFENPISLESLTELGELSQLQIDLVKQLKVAINTMIIVSEFPRVRFHGMLLYNSDNVFDLDIPEIIQVID